MVGITRAFLIVSHCGDSVLAFPRDYLRLIEGLGAVTSSNQTGGRRLGQLGRRPYSHRSYGLIC